MNELSKEELWDVMTSEWFVSPPPDGASVYANKGERITCENGHHIATFAHDVMRYNRTSVDDLKNWSQLPPASGAPSESLLCDKCGGRWQSYYHRFYINGIER